MAGDNRYDAPLYRSSIKEWPEDERPREKLENHGAGSLSEAELLAILINSGSGKRSALDLARLLLKEYGSLRKMSGLSAADFKQQKFKGIGKVKAIILTAAFELARRVQNSKEELPGPVRSPEDVAKIFIPELRDKKQEEFIVVILNSANKVIRWRSVTKGLLNSSLTHPREVFREAILENAASIILLHNHPSGNLEPSREDISITKQLADAGTIIGITVQDHIIIAGDAYTSLMERGLM
ncbi:MAG: RadC family protein [Bacteroidota bacterium]